MDIEWDFKKEGSNKLIAQGQWLDFPVSLRMEFEIEDENTVNWQAQININGDVDVSDFAKMQLALTAGLSMGGDGASYTEPTTAQPSAANASVTPASITRKPGIISRKAREYMGVVADTAMDARDLVLRGVVSLLFGGCRDS